ncbi:hypothetical protein [Halomarina rubra]|uniref:DUF1440 domain-containing protein n=1 Tax=Halomarina rubra TaxID=2071873 RepID=A0ABD6AQJ1_9EURY|nr:hypothetical protein [Halomarina rubra]
MLTEHFTDLRPTTDSRADAARFDSSTANGTAADVEERWRTVATSAVGGGLATVVMTLFREPTARSLPPTADFLGRWLGGAPEDYPVSALALHLVYGVVAGVVFGALWRRFVPRTSQPELFGILTGSAYGLVLSVFGRRVVLRHLVGMRLDPDEASVFHAGHLIYGVALGGWVGSRVHRTDP